MVETKKTMNYWKECLESSFSEAGIIATEEQINMVARDVEISHENYSIAFGYDCIPNPIKLELEETKRKLDIERRKVACKECNGKGYITDNCGFRSSTSPCHKCNGEGKVLHN